MKVIVADDSRVMRQIVIRTLRQSGYKDWDVVEAEDGADALAKVQAENPDLVLSDWNMPNMTGIQFLRALRAAGNNVPFAFVTSEGSEDMRGQAASAGALGLIAKPFTPETFSDVLDTANV
ncbi:two-component system, chemotaxis family, response regulator CheY [Jatrophihabitans endophyticus]|uniref:Two-component system, chemotaxis family, response regulator CheY n=1 Tax=Jatrophihabitans endophyticus TaxID=1206085 RepID=A0A1M5IIR0_9ACTN|nr:response regulator [Jatrophihabitans endophyticus]SHG28151.1 two-component system, chemotaxis family, response regulator CheY [Jatrophihabitans endophyticus]